MTRLPNLKISWRRGKQYTSSITLGGGGHNKGNSLPLVFAVPAEELLGVEEKVGVRLDFNGIVVIASPGDHSVRADLQRQLKYNNTRDVYLYIYSVSAYMG